jgi:hypothetical protein
MSKKLLLLLSLVVAISLFIVLPALPQMSTTDVKGKVIDENDEALPGARVFAKNQETGRERGVYTDRNGEYRLVALQPGTYEFTVEMEGFATQVVKDIVLNVGMVVSMNFTMKLSAVSETITVTGEAPLVETTESDISTVVNEQQITNLPLNGRTFSELAILAPGAERAVHGDPTKTRMGVFSLSGGAGRGSNISVDGGDDNDDVVGGQVQGFTAEGIQEFEVVTQRYKAEFGRATEGVVNVITKSGTNELHGTVFGFFRDDSLNKNEYFNEQAGIEKPKFARQQFGFSLGGPIVKDKTHFFAAYERMQEDNYVTVYTYGIFPEEEGAVKQPFRDHSLTARIDHTLNDKQFLMVRFAYQRNREEGVRVGGTATAESGAKAENFLHSFLVGHTYTISDKALNEFRFQEMWFHNKMLPMTEGVPSISFAHATFGTNNVTPQATEQRKFIFKDDYSLHQGIHDFKMGGEYTWEPTIKGFGDVLKAWFMFLGDTVNPSELLLYFTAGGDPNWGHRPTHKINLYWQDDLEVSEKLTLNLGVRYEAEKGIYFSQSTHRGVQWLMANRPDLYPNDPKDDYNNIMPRLGFAYDVKGDGKSVLRGGYGRYYDEIFANITLFADQQTFGNPPWGYTMIFLLGTDWASMGVNSSNLLDYVMANYVYVPGSLLVGQSIIQPNSATPYNDQFSIGFSRQLSDTLAIDTDLIYIRSRSEKYGNYLNRINPATGHNTISDEIGPLDFYNTDGSGRYTGLNLTLRKRFANKSQFIFNYTLSKAEGYTSLSWGGQPIDENNPLSDQEWGPRNYDSRHRFTFSGIVQLPAGFQLSGIVQYFSARPYNITSGNDDNGDGVTNDLPSDVPHRNYGRAGDFFAADVRVTKYIYFTGQSSLELMFEVFNVGNRVNFTSYDGNRLHTDSFGQPSQTLGNPMQAQLGVRFRW